MHSQWKREKSSGDGGGGVGGSHRRICRTVLSMRCRKSREKDCFRKLDGEKYGLATHATIRKPAFFLTLAASYPPSILFIIRAHTQTYSHTTAGTWKGMRHWKNHSVSLRSNRNVLARTVIFLERDLRSLFFLLAFDFVAVRMARRQEKWSKWMVEEDV